MTNLYRLSGESKIVYAIIIGSLLDKRTSITFKLKKPINNARISTTERPLVFIIFEELSKNKNI